MQPKILEVVDSFKKLLVGLQYVFISTKKWQIILNEHYLAATRNEVEGMVGGL